MKLNKRRTFFIATMFFAILMLWQVYYYYVPLFLEHILVDQFGDKDYHDIIGHIMSLDNLAAILIIPLFGWLSDRTKTRIGRRMPYIIVGCALSLVLFPLLAIMYLVNAIVWYFVIVVLLVLAMSSFRAPAVALMPDITPKPLRTNANAIINFIGYVGAIFGSVLTIIFAFSADKPDDNIIIWPFIITSIVILFVVTLFIVRYRENKIVATADKELTAPVDPCHKLSRRDKVNFALIIMAVFFCWFAFNALQAFGSLFAEEVLGETKDNRWGWCTTALAISSLLAFLPSIWLTKLIGRKWSVITGLCIVITALFIGALTVSEFNVWLVVLFAFSGIGWAIVMVNSYPMFVEISTSANVGRITGVYYLVSQGAMFLTSNISGYVFKWLGLDVFFWYAIIFMSISLLICFAFKEKRVQ